MKTTKKSPGLVASYDLRIGNEAGLFSMKILVREYIIKEKVKKKV